MLCHEGDLWFDFKMWNFSLTVFVLITVSCLPGTYGKSDFICRKLCCVSFVNRQLNFMTEEVLVKMAGAPCPKMSTFCKSISKKRCTTLQNYGIVDLVRSCYTWMYNCHSSIYFSRELSMYNCIPIGKFRLIQRKKNVAV